MKSYFESLEGYGVNCEHVPLKKEGWLTPTEALRKGGWFIKMSFGDDAGGASALKALQGHNAKLDGKYGKRAFRRFSRADMRVLGKVSTKLVQQQIAIRKKHNYSGCGGLGTYGKWIKEGKLWARHLALFVMAFATTQ